LAIDYYYAIDIIDIIIDIADDYDMMIIDTLTLLRHYAIIDITLLRH
jgi:hypothetical protein